MRGITLMAFLVALVLIMEVSLAGEVTGAGAAKLLQDNHFDVKQLKQSGHKILAGELTGAGKQVNLDRVKLVLTKKSVFDLSKAAHIEFKHPSNAKTLEDVEHLEFGRQKIRTDNIQALVIQ